MANEPNQASGTAPTDQTTTTDAATPKFMTADDFNGAMTARERRFEQRQSKMLEDFQKAIMSKLSPAAPAADDASEGGEGTTQAATPQAATAPNEQPSKEVLKLKDEVARIKKERQREREDVERERQARLVEDANGRVQQALVEAGSSGPHTKAAWALLSAEGRIKRDDRGEVCIELPRTYGGKTEPELIPLKEAIPEWLNSDAGKLFMPARGGGDGSGTVVRGGAPRTGAKLSKEEAKREAQAMLTKFVLGGNK